MATFGFILQPEGQNFEVSLIPSKPSYFRYSRKTIRLGFLLFLFTLKGVRFRNLFLRLIVRFFVFCTFMYLFFYSNLLLYPLIFHNTPPNLFAYLQKYRITYTVKDKIEITYLIPQNIKDERIARNAQG